jgi:hypothetical protein
MGGIIVLPSPTVVSASSSASTICAGGSVNLTSSATSNSNTTTTLLNQDFNSTPTGWTTTNTSNGGTTGNAAWSLRANGYSYTYGSDPAVIFNSNDNSQFYLTNSASQGSANTKTTLQSPAFSTVGLSAASLSFYQYFRAYSGTSAIVEISTNGTSWTALATYTTDKGNISPFVQETINLSSYLNQASVSIRFRYDGGWGWYWAVDNVSITGTLSTPPSASYAWTSSPGAFTSSTQNPTGVSPSATTTYTVTATNNYGCTATASTTVTVNSLPAVPTIAVTAPTCSSAATNILSTYSASLTYTSTPSGLSVGAGGVITGGTNGTSYTIRATNASSCFATSASFTFNGGAMLATPALTVSPNQSICSGSAATLTVSGAQSYIWSNSIGAVSSVTVTPGSTTTYTVTGTAANGCTNTASTTVTITQPTTSITIDGVTIGNGDYLWSGKINSNANVPGNWYVLNNGVYSVPNQVPQANHEVFVVNSSQAVSCVSSDLTIPNAGNFSSENIHIGQDANISVGNGASLNVRGNFINNGNVNAGSGTVNFTGNSAVQIIRGTGALNFSNVKIDKSAGKVSLNNDISISGTLEFQQGNLDLNGKTLNYSGGYGITTTNGGLIADAVQSKLNLTTSSQITDGLFHNGEIYDLTIATNASVSSSGSYTISNSLIVGNGATFTKEDGYTIIFKGDVVNNGAIVDGTSGIFGGSIVFNNTVNQTISGQPVSIANLEVVKASGKLIVSTPITITGKLEMNGNIDNPSSLITLGNSFEPGSLVYTSGTITGALRRYFPTTPGSSAYFPVGNTSNTRGATIAFTSSPGANQYLTVKYQGGAAGGTAPLYTGLPLTTGDGVLIQNFDEEGYWEINPTANDYAQSINTTPYTITLQMKNLSNVNDRSTVRVIKAAGSNNPSQHHGAWTALTFDANAVSGNSNSDFTVTGTSTGFSWFGAGSGNNNPLPVELVSFSGLCEEGVINLTWQTASEFNSSHFDVEKSRDGENWQLLSTVPSAGTSNELITYQSFDKNGTNGNNYYRLRQVDFDGKEKLYDPINVSCSEVTTDYFSSYPNPSGTSFQLVLNNKELTGACTLNMVDATGKVIEQREIEVKDGINMFVINQELTPGMYFLNISNGSKSTSVLRHAIK